MVALNSARDVIGATIRKDVTIYLRQWKTILTSLVLPGTYILVALLGSIAVGRSPIALVVQDRGTIASQMAQAMVDADVFRVSRVSPPDAHHLYETLSVGAIVTIPVGFSQAVHDHQSAPIVVQSNNLNLDFENDLRRSIPDAITLYYAQEAATPLPLTIQQHNLRTQNVELFQYEVVPLISLLVTVCGLIASSASTAGEFEVLSIKEILLAPVSMGTMVIGKIIAGWITTATMGLLLLLVGMLLGWIEPAGVFLLITLLAIALESLLAATAGIALGCVFRRVQAVSVLSTTGSVWLFFLSGGLGVLQFEPIFLRKIAAFDPLTYGTHMLQMAIFYQSCDRLGEDSAVLIGTTLALFLLCVVALHPQVVTVILKKGRTTP
ncbi:ABC transporter permease [Dictyobacter arantiisoli]|uniref:ABC-2 type transporter transmembrane domain-containing protein n=1 Tax=Dictyobacter arantiisoli TaxID=2014874 RepID=A0A5A5TJ35_9CHLR|nr:ABC transporter permease [Dictyobacter arantiisoli]GCF11235.1 hypothetical protein KDI_47990 [Dictyobacter arantiisoli]